MNSKVGNWRSCNIAHTSMCKLSTELLGLLCAKHCVSYEDYTLLVKRLQKFAEFQIYPLVKCDYIAYATPGFSGNYITFNTASFWLTYTQFLQVCEFIHAHSTRKSAWETSQLVSWFAYCYPDLIQPSEAAYVRANVVL